MPNAPSKSVVYAIMLLVCTAFSQQPPLNPTKSVSEVVHAALDSVVSIAVNDGFGKPLKEGSGFIVSSDGKIVTNHHVIAGGHSALVKLNSGATFPIEGVVSDDEVHDIAVIKVSGRNLPALVLGDSDLLSVGEHVIAIGSPLGLENSVSDGIVSSLRDDGKGTQLIQTTAPASPGNSGGPLLDSAGKVIGVMTLKMKGENLNFAVPSKLVSAALLGSGVRPLGDSNSIESVSKLTDTNLWTSLQTGHDYKLRRDGGYIYSEWVNLPPQLQSTSAFIRSELKQDGEKWVGTTRAYMPCQYKSSYSEFWTTGQTRGTPNIHWCSLQSEIRIDKLSDNRIEGMTDAPTEFDCRKCAVKRSEWKPFTLIPK